jgi:hypothetical protein
MTVKIQIPDMNNLHLHRAFRLNQRASLIDSLTKVSINVLSMSDFDLIFRCRIAFPVPSSFEALSGRPFPKKNCKLICFLWTTIEQIFLLTEYVRLFHFTDSETCLDEPSIAFRSSRTNSCCAGLWDRIRLSIASILNPQNLTFGLRP